MKKAMALMLATFMALSLFMTACRSEQEPGGQTETNETTDTQTTEKSDKLKTLRWSYTRDLSPATLNAHDSVDTFVQDLYNFSHSGLYMYVPNDDGDWYELIPDIAAGEPYQVDEDGYVWRIDIREDAVWHNGEAINADTIMYSWRMLLDPILVNRMGNFLYDRFVKIVNAKEYYFQANEGEPAVDFEDVGIKKVGEHTIELTLTQKSSAEYVMRHLTDRSTYPVYEPYYEAGMNEDRTETTYGTDLDQYMGCGPYLYDTWIIEAQHSYVKNAEHWMSDLYNYDAVDIRITPDRNARVTMFENGELDRLDLDSVTLEHYKDDPRTLNYTSISPIHLEINAANTDNPILDNANFRKALFYGMDRVTVAGLLGCVPAAYYVNHQAPGYDGMSYRETEEAKALVPENYGYDPELAKEYFDKALEDLGLDSVTVDLLYYETSVGEKAFAEYLQELWKEMFGADKFTLTIRTVPNATYSETKDWRKNPTGYDLAFSDWGASLSRAFPYAAFNYFHSGYASRPNSYITEDFDAAFQACDTEEAKSDAKIMVQLTAALEEIYMRDVINVPMFQTVEYNMYSERIILPCKVYVPFLGFGMVFGDIEE